MHSRYKVLIHLAKLEKAEECARELDGDQYETQIVQSTDELYQLVNHQRVDAVVLEQELPGFLSGLEVVERFRQHLLEPVMILLTKQVTRLNERARSLRIQATLSSEESGESIAETVRSCVKTACHSGIHIPFQARKLVKECDVIPPLPQLIIKLSTYLDDPQVSLAQVAHDIAADANVTATLLRLTNSVSTGIRQKVTQVQDAVTLLGMRRTVALILSAFLQSSQRTLTRQLDSGDQAWLQVRTVLLASTASSLSSTMHQMSGETAHVLGLLEGLGIPVLAWAYGSDYQQILERCRTRALLNLPVVEAQEFGVTHSEVSAALLQKWSLPASIVKLILAQHQAEPGTLSEVERRLLHSTRTGEAFSDFRDLPSLQRHQRLSRLLQEYGDPDSSQIRNCMIQAVGKAMEFGELFQIEVPPTEEWNSLIENMSKVVGLHDETSSKDSGELPEDIQWDKQPEQELESAEAGEAVSEKQEPILLVVDDEEAIFRSIRRLLRKEKLQLRYAATYEAALAQAGKASLILCDIHLPAPGGEQGNGLDLIRELRSLRIPAQIIGFSGDRSRSTVIAAIQAGVVDYIGKPFPPEKLLEKIHQHLRNSTIPQPVMQP